VSQSEDAVDEVGRANFLNGVATNKGQIKDEEVRRAGLSRKVKTSVVPNSDADPEFYVNLNKRPLVINDLNTKKEFDKIVYKPPETNHDDLHAATRRGNKYHSLLG
jgi:hypothetical protein